MTLEVGQIVRTILERSQSPALGYVAIVKAWWSQTARSFANVLASTVLLQCCSVVSDRTLVLILISSV